MTKVTVRVIGGNIIIAGVDAPLEIVTADPPPVDPPPVDPPPVDPPPVVPVTSPYMWVSPDKIRSLPKSGAAYSAVKAAADAKIVPDLKDQNAGGNVDCLAAAYMYVATELQVYLDKVLYCINAIVNDNLEAGARALGLARELPAYIIAAQTIGLAQLDPALDAKFRQKIWYLRTFKTIDGPASVLESSLERPNNWGGHAHAMIAAIAAYLGDKAELDRAYKVFCGWLGDRSSYAGFKYGSDLSWQADKTHPVGINLPGATIEGHNMDGAQPEELRRGGSFSWPLPANPPTYYPYEGLQGPIMAGIIYENSGHPEVWGAVQSAMKRAILWLYNVAKWPAIKDDCWQIFLFNHAYPELNLPTSQGSPGKNMAWTSWTHA